MTRRMRVSRTGLDLIRSFEGFFPQAVRLRDGRFLIGYGHTRTAREGAEISEADAMALLREYDLRPIEKAVNAWVLAPMHQNEFDALVSFAFNIGLKAFRGSNVLALANSGEMLAAAEAMAAWRKARVDGRLIVVDALVRRRAAEKAHFLEHPGGRTAVASALISPVLDIAAAMLTPRERSVLVESIQDDSGEGAEVRVRTERRAPVAAATRPPAEPRAAATDRTEVAETTRAERATERRPEAAAREVAERLSRIIGVGEATPAPKQDAAMTPQPVPSAPTEAAESVDGSTIDEITRAVSALAQPEPGADAAARASVASGIAKPQRRPAARDGAAPDEAATDPAADDMFAPAEDVMARIREELRAAAVTPGSVVDAPRSQKAGHVEEAGRSPAWPWALVMTVGVATAAWGFADRFGWLPVDLTLSGGEMDRLPPLLVLAGLLLIGFGLWNLTARSLEDDSI